MNTLDIVSPHVATDYRLTYKGKILDTRWNTFKSVKEAGENSGPLYDGIVKVITTTTTTIKRVKKL